MAAVLPIPGLQTKFLGVPSVQRPVAIRPVVSCCGDVQVGDRVQLLLYPGHEFVQYYLVHPWGLPLGSDFLFGQRAVLLVTVASVVPCPTPAMGPDKN